MSTWKCPNSGTTNPPPIHSRQEITCTACAESFNAEYNNNSAPPKIGSENSTVELTPNFYNGKLFRYSLTLFCVANCVFSVIAVKNYLFFLLLYLFAKLYGF